MWTGPLSKHGFVTSWVVPWEVIIHWVILISKCWPISWSTHRAGSSQVWGRTPRAHGHPQVGRELGQSCSFPGRRHLAYSQGGSLLSTRVWLPQSFSVPWREQARSLRTLPFSRLFIGTQLSSSLGGQSPRLPSREESPLVKGEWRAEEAATEGGQGRGQAWKRGAASQWGVSLLHPDLHGIPGISVCGCECFFLEGPGLYQVKMLTEWRKLPWSPSPLEFFLLKRKFSLLAVGPGLTATQFLLFLSSPESLCIMSHLPPFLRPSFLMVRAGIVGHSEEI